MNFAGQTVLITGAAGNLGRAVAAAFAAKGAQLVLVDLRVSDLVPAASHAELVQADLLDEAQAQAMADSATRRFGELHVVCHLAGGFRMGEAVHETSQSSWDFLTNLNARSMINVARATVPLMISRGGGKFVTVGAAAAQKGLPQMGAYCASKSALMRLTESMAAELKERNINVNCVMPSIIDTPENRAAMPEADPSRWVPPEALAEAIVFLASDQARYIHGACLPVTGLS